MVHTPVVGGGGGAAVDDGTDTLRNIEVARFTDGDLALVNRAPTGAAILSDLTPTEGSLLNVDTSTIDDENGVGAFSFQWLQSGLGGAGAFTVIAGATSAVFTPLQAQVNRLLQSVVTFTDGLGNVETVTSVPTTRVVGDLFAGTKVSRRSMAPRAMMSPTWVQAAS